MTSFIVTVEEDAVVAAKAALAAIENAVVTDIAPELEAGLLGFLQSAASVTVTYLGGFLKKLVADITGDATTPVTSAPTETPAAS